jgi:hypothetical protein
VAKGSIDYVLMFNWFSIVVVEGKLHDQLLKHSGQLAAEMRAAREQFSTTMLGKRKHEPDEDFSQVGQNIFALALGCMIVSGLADRSFVTHLQVPSVGILSSGTQYIFFKYDPAATSITRSSSMAVPLVPGITAQKAATVALPVIRRLVQAIENQKLAMKKIATLPSAVRRWTVGPEAVPEQTAKSSRV